MATYRTILVGIEFSPLDDVALQAAASIAERAGTERIHLAHAFKPITTWPAGPYEVGASNLDAIWKAALESARERIAQIQVPDSRAAFSRAVRVGPPSRELASEADEIDADLIVIASHDRKTLGRLALGSVASSLLRAASRPMLVVSLDRPLANELLKIVAAVDLSPGSRAVLQQASNMARMYDGSICALSIYETHHLAPFIEKEIFPKVDDDLRTTEHARRGAVEALLNEVVDPSVKTTIEVVSKAPVHNAIIDVASLLSSQLLVVGTSGHGAWHRFFLGSTATHVVTEAPCPVLVVPRPDLAKWREEAAA